MSSKIFTILLCQDSSHFSALFSYSSHSPPSVFMLIVFLFFLFFFKAGQWHKKRFSISTETAYLLSVSQTHTGK